MTDEKPKRQEFSQTLACCMMMFTLFILINPELQIALGTAVGAILYPLIGFGHEYPFMTLLCAAFVMSTISIGARNIFMDWVGMARMQRVNKAFQKEMKDARLSNNASKLKRLTEYQQDMMKDQMGQQTNMMKPMAYTMLIIIAIFTWIRVFMGELPDTSFSVPWAYNVSFNTRIPYCLLPLPAWVGIYSSLSIPLGQVFTHVLKTNDFKKRLAKLESGEWEAGDEEPKDALEEVEEEDEDLEEMEDLDEDEEEGREEPDDEEEEEHKPYVCGKCHAPVGADDEKCPECGEEFD